MKWQADAALCGSCLVQCEQTKAENWLAFAADIMQSLCMKRAIVTYPLCPLRGPQLLLPLPLLTLVRPEHHDLTRVFSKVLALSLRPHRPYKWFPGASLTSSHLYHLSRPEREYMETCISDLLTARFIRPSSSLYPQQIQYALTFLTGCCSVISPIQFIFQVSSQVQVLVDV